MLRLLIALAFALFALPGMASACHDTPPAAMMAQHGMHHEAPGNPDAVAPHACVGCIPPSTWVAASLAPRLPRLLPLRRMPVPALHLAAAPAPDTPPPRERG